jgi:carboxypeptidase Q
MKKLLLIISISLLTLSCITKSEKKVSKNLSSEEKADSTHIKTLFNSVLKDGKSYRWLKDLTQNIGGRLFGEKN